jgi:hypothetical protein
MVRLGQCIAIAPLIGLGPLGELETATIPDGHLQTADFFVLWNQSRAELTQAELTRKSIQPVVSNSWARRDYIRQFLVVSQEYAKEAGVIEQGPNPSKRSAKNARSKKR